MWVGNIESDSVSYSWEGNNHYYISFNIIFIMLLLFKIEMLMSAATSYFIAKNEYHGKTNELSLLLKSTPSSRKKINLC